MKIIILSCLIITTLINVSCSSPATHSNSAIAQNSENTTDKSNSEAKKNLLNGLLNDLKAIDNGYSKSKAESMPNANKAKYMNDLGDKYLSLTQKTYESILNLNNNDETIEADEQNALDNIKKASSDVELSIKKAGGGSSGSTNIAYAKMNSARQEVCNALKTYLDASDNDLVWDEMNNNNAEIDNSFKKIQTDYISINRKSLGNDAITIPDVKIVDSTPSSGNEKVYIVTSSMIIPDSGLGNPKYYPIKMELQYDKNGEYTFKYLDPNEIN